MFAEYHIKRNLNNFSIKTNLNPKDYSGKNVARDLAKFHNLWHRENSLQAHVTSWDGDNAKC